MKVEVDIDDDDYKILQFLSLIKKESILDIARRFIKSEITSIKEELSMF